MQNLVEGRVYSTSSEYHFGTNRMAMASSKDVGDRVQKKRVQNRAAQQKYREFATHRKAQNAVGCSRYIKEVV
jgi:hypothetical protein